MESEKNKQSILTDCKIASNLAHGVRNPLNAIKGAVIYLREKYMNDKTLMEFTKIMEEEILRLDNFLTGFLNKMAFPNLELSKADINSLLREVEILTFFQADAYNIKTEYIYRSVPFVMVDSFQLKHAVLNIVNNATEAMPDGGKLCVTSGTEKQNDCLYVVIEISDTGSGMKWKKNENGREPRASGGRGYGLNITREVFQAHGGYMSLRSRKRRGTVVRLYLPVNHADDGGRKHEC